MIDMNTKVRLESSIELMHALDRNVGDRIWDLIYDGVFQPVYLSTTNTKLILSEKLAERN